MRIAGGTRGSPCARRWRRPRPTSTRPRRRHRAGSRGGQGKRRRACTVTVSKSTGPPGMAAMPTASHCGASTRMPGWRRSTRTSWCASPEAAVTSAAHLRSWSPSTTVYAHAGAHCRGLRAPPAWTRDLRRP
jgi:hypothetical protein